MGARKGCYGFIKHHRDVPPNSCFCHRHWWHTYNVSGSWLIHIHSRQFQVQVPLDIEKNRKKPAPICKTAQSQWKASKTLVPCCVDPSHSPLILSPNWPCTTHPILSLSNFSILYKVLATKLFPQKRACWPTQSILTFSCQKTDVKHTLRGAAQRNSGASEMKSIKKCLIKQGDKAVKSLESEPDSLGSNPSSPT